MNSLGVYRRNSESRACECGGKRCLTPSIKLKHEETMKHREWLFRKLSWEFLELTEQREKVEKLKVMKTIVCV
jgi:hypothetical protein